MPDLATKGRDGVHHTTWVASLREWVTSTRSCRAEWHVDILWRQRRAGRIECGLVSMTCWYIKMEQWGARSELSPMRKLEDQDCSRNNRVRPCTRKSELQRLTSGLVVKACRASVSNNVRKVGPGRLQNLAYRVARNIESAEPELEVCWRLTDVTHAQ